MASISSANELPRVKTLVITETGPSTSFDPLDADGWQNMPVMRMLYATPFIISPDASLSSQILDSFSYNPGSHEMIWNLKSGIKFSDGAPLTAEDVAFAIARFAHVRPNFPVVESIQGVKEWNRSTEKGSCLEKLPSGIEISGNQITIKFTKAIKHPFFRFSLEVFSIIPRKNVNLKTNQLISNISPFSGPFELTKRETNSADFRLRKNSGLAQLDGIPSNVVFRYVQPDELLSMIPSLTKDIIISGNELNYDPGVLQGMSQSADLRYLQSTWFALFILNTKDPIFKKDICRTWFVREFQKVLKSTYGTGINQESSLFSKILPGYLTEEQLAKPEVSNSVAEHCAGQLRKHGLRWAKVKGTPTSIFQQTLEKLLKNFGVDPKAELLKSREEQGTLFSTGRLSIFEGFTGFWALDPSGDLKMLFTPKMHPPLNSLAGNGQLQHLIEEVEKSESETSYRAVNRYLARDSIFNVYMHVRRFYIANKGNQVLTKIPMSLGSIVPWQVFETH